MAAHSFAALRAAVPTWRSAQFSRWGPPGRHRGPRGPRKAWTSNSGMAPVSAHARVGGGEEDGAEQRQEAAREWETEPG